MINVSFSEVGKKFGETWIFQNVSGEFTPGIHAITGKNGSGKSTLLQVLSGFVSANTGTVSHSDIDGRELEKDAWFKHLSICSPMMELFEELQVEESVNLHRRMKPLTLDTAQLLKEVQLDAHANKTLEQLSSGMKQRLKLALTIFSDSQVVFFDEPCSNLDAEWSEWYGKRVATMGSTKTIIIASNSQALELTPVNGQHLDLK